MKKQHKQDDELEEADGLPEITEEADDGSIWLDTGDETIQLPKEIAEYLESSGIMGMA